jgi:hypothetical protein
MSAYLKICGDVHCSDNIHFANKVKIPDEGIYIGSFIVDNSVKSSVIPRALPSAAQKQNAPVVQRERNSVIIRDGEKRYKPNGAKH